MTTPAGPARVLGDRYELTRRLGSGGAGSVWEGYDRALDRPVAVKLLHADLADDPAVEARFRTEATAAAKLTHPSAVLVYDVGRDGDDDYLVMELVEGTSLAAVLVDGPLPAGASAAIGAAVASALGSAHRADIVHRDVKPGNVLLTGDGHAKLADFGIARALGDLESRLTRTGTVLGTARYLAPEQLRDDPLDGRADVYSLGVVLHEVLTGAAPFGEGGAVEVATRRLTTSLPAVTDLVDGVPPELAEIVDWATQVDPRSRPSDGDELAAALRPFADADADAAIAARVATVRGRRGHRGAAPGPSPAPPSAARPVGPTAAPVRSPAEEHAGDTSALAPVGATTRQDATATLAGPAPGAADHDTSATVEGGGGRVPSWLLMVLLAAAAVLGVVVLAPILSGDQDPDGAAPGGDGGEDAEVRAVEVAAAGDHDPQGSDLEERPQDVPLAIDGDTETFWPSQTYTSADLGGLKDGVGIWLELEEPVDLDRVDLRVTTEGGRVELWVGEGAPADDQLPDDWGQLIGEGDITSTAARFPLSDRDVTADTLLLWFTELPPGGGDFRVEVREVEVFAR